MPRGVYERQPWMLTNQRKPILTLTMKVFIQKKRDCGESLQCLASRFDVSKPTIQRVLKQMARRPTLLIDFDGTLSQYTGWKGIDAPLDPPLLKARHSLLILEREYKLVCFTTRPPELVEPWLWHHGFPLMKVTNFKEPAHLIIDDRAICFTGEWSEELLSRIRSFAPHWQTTSSGVSKEGQPEPQPNPQVSLDT